MSFNTSTKPEAEQPRQLRLDSLLAGVTLAAALFAWVRTWESGTRSMIVWLSAMLAAWAVPVVIARGLCRSRLFRERSYLWTVVVSQCWFPAGVLTFVAAWGPFDDWDDVAAAIYFVMTNLAIAGITAILVAWFVDGCFTDRDEDRQAQWIGAITTPLMIVVFTVVNVGPPDLLFAGLLAATVGLFSTGFFIPFGMIFAMRAMDLRTGADPATQAATKNEESGPATERSPVAATEGAAP
ncbi:MAG: hypothetical protein JNK76_07695 [Planctomycetales bacterium]|nr:hypothetical protein [Planctomycetales bacterium]MBN8626092.1 hypothetical protein [Planctomycetota bacterium]